MSEGDHEFALRLLRVLDSPEYVHQVAARLRGPILEAIAEGSSDDDETRREGSNQGDSS